MGIIFLTILISIFVIGFLIRSKGSHHAKTLKAALGILHGATCVLNETNIHTSKPVALHGRVDQVFQLKNGIHLVIDTKVRERIKVYPSDVVQLSVVCTDPEEQRLQRLIYCFITLSSRQQRKSYLQSRSIISRKQGCFSISPLYFNTNWQHKKCFVAAENIIRNERALLSII